MSDLTPHAAAEDNWPYPERRYPKREDPDCLGSKGLSVALREVIRTELAGLKDLDVLDVGCGRKPFYPFFKPIARSYPSASDAAGEPRGRVPRQEDARAARRGAARHGHSGVLHRRKALSAARPGPFAFANPHVEK